MDAKREDYYTMGELMIGVRSFMDYLLKKWWLLSLFVLAGAGLGAGYYFMQKPKYEAVTTFILEEKSSGGGGLVGLASQFGLNLGSLSGSGSMFAGDNILTILKSKKVVQQVLLSQVGSEVPSSNTLADLYLEFTGVKKSWQKNSQLANIDFRNSKETLSPLQDSILNTIYEVIIKKNLVTERTSKQSSIIRVMITAENALFARLMTERLVEEASNMYLDIRIGTAQDNIRQLQRRSDSLLLLLNNKSYHVAAGQPLDLNPGLRTASVPVEIATRDKTVLATLYAELIKNLEASKLMLAQQTPIIQLLDKPGFLLRDNRKGLFFLVAVSSFVAGLIYVVSSSLFFYFHKKS
jgi:hypothetical protein